MQKTVPAFLIVAAACAALALAQDAQPASDAPKSKKGAADGRPAYVPTPKAQAEPPAEKRGVLQSLFGSRLGQRRPLFNTTPAPKLPVATPIPVAKATPKPKVEIASEKPAPRLKKKRSKPKPEEETPETPKVAAKTKVKPAEDTTETTDTPKPAATPAPKSAGRKGQRGAKTTAAAAVEPGPDADPEAKEKFRFDKVKAEAAADPTVQELKQKADSAATDEEARSAQRAYNKALFNRMKKIDDSLSDRIDQMEAAVLKRLGNP
jgi:hypothetical protein